MAQISKARALRELAETTAELVAARAHVARLEATRDRRIIRAVSLGIDKAHAARVAGVARQRVGQIVGTGAEA